MCFQTDNGGEFDSSASRTFFALHDIVFRLTCPYTSQQNGRAERVLLTLNDCVRTLLFQAHILPPSGLMPSQPPPTSLIGARANLVTTPPPLSCSLAPRLPTTISEYLGASVTQISPPLHHTNSRHDQCAVCFLAIPLIRKDTSAITWTAKELLSHVMSPSTRPVFHLCRDNTLQQHRPNRTHHSSRTRF